MYKNQFVFHDILTKLDVCLFIALNSLNMYVLVFRNSHYIIGMQEYLSFGVPKTDAFHAFVFYCSVLADLAAVVIIAAFVVECNFWISQLAAD